MLIVTTVPETVKAFLLPQVKQLKLLDWEIHVATGKCGCKLPELAQMGIREHRMPLARTISPFSDLLAMFSIIRLCRKYKFDLIHTHTLKASLVGQLGARLAGVPVRVETAHGTRYMPDLSFFVRNGIIWSERLAARQAHRVWVLNQEDLEFFKRHSIGKPNTVKLLGKGGIGLDIDQYSPSILEGQAINDYRQSIGVPPDAPVIGFVGRMVRDKGVNELFQAWMKLSTQIPSAYLLIISAVLPSERQSEIVSEKMFKKLKNCVFLTNRNDMNKLYRCMNVFVLPSYREGFSRSIMEAMASGVPVVATDVKGCRDVVVANQTGLLVPCGNSDLLFGAIYRLITDKSLQESMSENARRWSVQYFDQCLVNEHIRQTYEKFLKALG